MVETRDKLSSHCWWFDSEKKTTPNRSSWLQSTLSELDDKTEAMLKIIEQDADSFAQRAEMYYKKRPQLVNMVEDFYRAHRLLAEKYDQTKSEFGSRLLTPWMSPLSFTKYPQEKLMSPTAKSYDSYSETFDPDSESSDDMSEVEDPEFDEDIQIQPEEETVREAPNGCPDNNDEILKLRDEIEKLKEENKAQKELLLQKDEEKREAIRQLSLAVDLVREENVILRKTCAKAASQPKENSIESELKTFKESFWKKLFSGST